MSKVKDLKRYISQNNKRLIPAISADILEFIGEYNTYGMIYDAKLQDYANLPLLNVEEMDDEAFEDIQEHIKMMLYMNKYKYNELYKTLFYDYNPLNNTEWREVQRFGKKIMTDENGERNTDNVYGERGSETVSLYGEQLQTNSNGKREQTSDHGATQTTDVISQRTNQDTMGQQKTTDVIAARTNQDVMAQQKTTDVIGSRTNSDSFGAQTHTDAAAIDKTTHKSNGYDSAVGTADGEDEAHIGQRQHTESEHTDAHTIGGGTDTHTTDAHTDSHTLGGGTDTHTVDTYTDTHTIGGGTDTHSAQAYTDKVTDAAVTDTVKNNQHEDTVTNTADAYTDSVKQYAATDKHTEDAYENTIERAGNIGVTTSAQLIKEQRGIVDWSFWEVLYNDIINEICLPMW